MARRGTLELKRDQLDATRTVVIWDGKPIASIPWQQCDEIAASFTRAARAGEEQAKGNQIIRAQALLERTGAPFALSNDPKIRDAAHTEAQWDSGVRRTMPLRGTPSARKTGIPTIIKHKGD
jgi:hypothetical protein